MNLAPLFSVPYIPGGRSRSGFDCWGLAMEIYRMRGIELPDEPAGVDPFTPLQHPLPWCIVAFRLDSPAPTHVGVVLDDCKTFIHIREKKPVAIDRLDSRAWAPRIEGFYGYNERRSLPILPIPSPESSPEQPGAASVAEGPAPLKPPC